jgi:predicted HAD superfamily Cof-like phosphohydrolase
LKNTGFKHVEEFHKAFGHPIQKKPVEADMKTVKLRLALILEEFIELSEASLSESSDNVKQLLKTLNLAQEQIKALEEIDKDVDLVEVADALTDINYVTYGAGHCYGINLDSCMEEVQKSNMSKLGADGQPLYNDMGKIMKGPNYQKPNLKKLLFDEA